MKQETRKEMLQNLLSHKSHKVAVRTAKTPSSCFMASYRCCTKGEWKQAATQFTSAMNLIWTSIVNPIAGANRKN
ncbi:MAG: hypothetical protein HOI88_01175 [Phycisphaerae bacterium]|jgi:hypothetical protein|nr:hypothetical protein [Phycisphaerae bacterium]MBT6268948.1 hypothetical protein [Phycisphaerae bacterium]MBT6283026.1 hypothetical protein [Phycisphaerae bacterium]MBT7657311.1 hypothetical protein [Phycisphaerae bacterium]